MSWALQNPCVDALPECDIPLSHPLSLQLHSPLSTLIHVPRINCIIPPQRNVFQDEEDEEDEKEEEEELFCPVPTMKLSSERPQHSAV